MTAIRRTLGGIGYGIVAVVLYIAAIPIAIFLAVASVFIGPEWLLAFSRLLGRVTRSAGEA